MLKKLLFIFFLLILAAMAAFFAGKAWLNDYAKRTIDIKEQTLFTVPAGTGRVGLEKLLTEQKIISDTKPFPYLLKFYPELTGFKAGTYRLDPGMTVEQLMQLLKSGKEAQFSIQFIEGMRMKDWLAVLAQAPGVQQTLTGLNERQIAEKLDVSEGGLPEGWLYPDTYLYTSGTTDLAILQRAHSRMKTALDNEWRNRDENLPYATPYEMLIMASIIEKETGVAHERTKVASVFINRLRIKMKLQTDPTVIYGMGDSYNGTITRSALNTPTPYNTYAISGLPPTPIAMPSLASLKAAAHPDETNYLYFVATGNGGHTFSKDLKGHNRAVSEYRKVIGGRK
jgi:UPF0755 protein